MDHDCYQLFVQGVRSAGALERVILQTWQDGRLGTEAWSSRDKRRRFLYPFGLLSAIYLVSGVATQNYLFGSLGTTRYQSRHFALRDQVFYSMNACENQ